MQRAGRIGPNPPMLRLKPHAFAVLSLALAAGPGCQTKQSVSSADVGTGESGYTVQPFESRPKVTAETYFAAGQFHETSVVSRTDQRETPDERQRRLKTQRKLATTQYEKALALDPSHGPSLFRLGALSTEAGEHEQAMDYWQRYVDATGGTATAWTNLAVAAEVAGQRGEAEEAYRNAITADPADRTPRVNLGMLLAKDGRLQEAAAQLSSVLEPAAVHWHLAHALEDRGDMTAANRHFRAAASLDPQYRREG